MSLEKDAELSFRTQASLKPKIICFGGKYRRESERSVKRVKEEDILKVKLYDGVLEAKVNKIEEDK